MLGQGIPPVIYADYIDGSGIALFRKACELDLEGIVAKHKYSSYAPEETTWFKIEIGTTRSGRDGTSCLSGSGIENL